MSNEWYTPPVYVNAAREVMWGIELDPASCVEANYIVKADRFFTKEQNGLAQEWKARSLWLNPPYARTSTYQSGIGLFVKKCLEAYRSGDVGQAVILATAEMNAAWFQPLAGFIMCVPDHRVNFLSPERNSRGVYSHMFGTIFVYLGTHEDRFTNVFSKFGNIYQRLNHPQAAKSTKQLNMFDESA